MHPAGIGKSGWCAPNGDAIFRVAIVTVASVLLSIAITACATLMFFGVGFGNAVKIGEVWRFSMAAGIGVPALVCPLVAWRMILMMRDLSEARAALDLASRTDQLTGLLNRRGLDLEAERIVAVARRDRLPLAVMICDIDFFKSVNDEFGHDAGDKVLRHVAGIMRSAVGERNAVLARQGGEEFAILLPGVDERDAEIVAEDLRRACASSRIVLTAQTAQITMSIGLSFERSLDLDFSLMMRRADSALYRAKRGGRNQVAAASLSMLPLTNGDGICGRHAAHLSACQPHPNGPRGPGGFDTGGPLDHVPARSP